MKVNKLYKLKFSGDTELYPRVGIDKEFAEEYIKNYKDSMPNSDITLVEI